MKTSIRAVLALTVLCILSGCATILSGRTQTITVNSNPPGARCELVREGNVVGSVESTPGAVTLVKTKHDIDVVCKKGGFVEAKEFAKSGTEGSVFGNIILGGGIGWAIDSAAGTDNKYPEVVTVNLVPASSSAMPVTKPPPAKEPKPSPAMAKVTGPLGDIHHQLSALKKMKDEGLLTDEEYERKRSAIIEKF